MSVSPSPTYYCELVKSVLHPIDVVVGVSERTGIRVGKGAALSRLPEKLMDEEGSFRAMLRLRRE